MNSASGLTGASIIGGSHGQDSGQVQLMGHGQRGNRPRRSIASATLV